MSWERFRKKKIFGKGGHENQMVNGAATLAIVAIEQHMQQRQATRSKRNEKERKPSPDRGGSLKGKKDQSQKRKEQSGKKKRSRKKGM